MAVIRIPEEIWRKVRAHLMSRPGEHFAFMCAEYCATQDGPIFLVKDVHCVMDENVRADRDGYTVTPEGFLPAINMAVRNGTALIECHNHGGAQPGFSQTDRRGLPEFSQYVLDSLPGRPYAATVWGDCTIHGEFFATDGGGIFRSITVVGERFRQVTSQTEDAVRPDVAFDRQILWFTDDGQRGLGHIRAAIVGAGGTGSQMAQQLAYLGIRDFVVVDDDAADDTSMNRLVTAAAADIGTPKAFLARRAIKSIAPSAKVRVMLSRIQSDDVLDALKQADVIFGCVDNDGARLILNDISRAYCILYVDLAVGIEVEASGVVAAGGRVVVVTPGGPCLHCLDEIDITEAGFFLSDAKARAFQVQRGYVKGMDVPAPSVVSLNAAVTAAAVNEFAIMVSGIRPANVYTELDLLGTAYEAKGQRAGPRRVRMSPGCVVCASAGIGDRAGIERYARPAG
ncbi:MAG: ThiF family adenylyltransferase [Spirochaetes bacterium]|nr:ThiF family adenylyltransferase [Spirochaetota bacterium]